MQCSNERRHCSRRFDTINGVPLQVLLLGLVYQTRKNHYDPIFSMNVRLIAIPEVISSFWHQFSSHPLLCSRPNLESISTYTQRHKDIPFSKIFSRPFMLAISIVFSYSGQQSEITYPSVHLFLSLSASALRENFFSPLKMHDSHSGGNKKFFSDCGGTAEQVHAHYTYTIL